MIILNRLKQKMYLSRQMILGFLILSALALRVDGAYAAELTDVRFTKLPGDKVQINIGVNGAIQEPGQFTTITPARVAFDFFGSTKAFQESLVKIGIGNVDSLIAVETDDRTRVILNLLESTPFTSQMIDTGYVITLDGPQINYAGGRFDSDNGVVSSTPAVFANQPEMVSSKYINSVDFRRNSKGGGKLIVELSDESTSVNVQEQGGKISLNFGETTLQPGLEKRLDVVDFATPVDSIDVYQQGSDVAMLVSSNDKFRQVSYQSGTTFTLIVDKFTETDEEREEREKRENQFTGDRLSINFQKIEVRAALAVISDFTGINIVTSDDVEGELTLNLKDVPWDQALDVIMKTKGLDKRVSGDVIYVAPSQQLAEQEQLEKEAQEALADIEPLVSEVIKINYASAVELREVLLGEEDSSSDTDNVNTVINLGGEEPNKAGKTNSNKVQLKITADARSNSLIVTSTASNLKAIRLLVQKLDSPLRQVLIETRIVEAEDNFSRSLGAKLGFQRLTENAQVPGSSSILASDSIIGATNEGNTTLSNSLIDDDPGLLFEQGSSGQNVDLGADALSGERAASYALQLFKAGRGYANLISLELSALEANGNGKIVASPRLVAADNTEASIRQGQVRIFEVRGGGANGNGIETLEREAVLSLTVTPQITPDDRVVLNVNITQDSFQTLDIINTKEVNTQVLVDNGETIVIGGIYQENESVDVAKVPVLGDVPYLKNLFRKKTTSEVRTELIIFLTPRIINESLRLR